MGQEPVGPWGIWRKAQCVSWKKGTEPRRTAPQETAIHARVVVEALEGGRGEGGQGNRYHQALTGVGIHLTFAIPLPAAYLLGGRTQATPACVTEEHVDELPVIVKVKLLKERETASKRDSGKAWYKKNYFPPVFQFHTPIPMKSYLCIFFSKEEYGGNLKLYEPLWKENWQNVSKTVF